ncbi:MAG: LysR family transcriptional regulator [Rhodospirillales bacterium]|nr:LysR family transcriptional regulator [Rhodospirillales bacterium]
MEMHQIRYFLAVAQELNFTRAAERCNVTQPALTRAIQKLEEELGGLLFRRERNLTHLTDLGHLMRPHLEQVLRETEAAKTTAGSFLRLSEAPLNLGIMCTIGPLRFIGFLNRFRTDNPGIELTLMEATPARLSALLTSGQLDVAVMAQPESFDERLVVLPLYRERFMVAFPPGHRFESRNALTVEDIAGESYLSRINCEYSDKLSSICSERDVDIHVTYRSEREDWIQTMVTAGMGICFLPEFSSVLPGLQRRPLVDPEVVREVSLVTVAGRRYSPAVATFIRAIRAFRWPEQEDSAIPPGAMTALAKPRTAASRH